MLDVFQDFTKRYYHLRNQLGTRAQTDWTLWHEKFELQIAGIRQCGTRLWVLKWTRRATITLPHFEMFDMKMGQQKESKGQQLQLAKKNDICRFVGICWDSNVTQTMLNEATYGTTEVLLCSKQLKPIELKLFMACVVRIYSLMEVPDTFAVNFLQPSCHATPFLPPLSMPLDGPAFQQQSPGIHSCLLSFTSGIVLGSPGKNCPTFFTEFDQTKGELFLQIFFLHNTSSSHCSHGRFASLLQNIGFGSASGKWYWALFGP